jgi:hypothetical protein
MPLEARPSNEESTESRLLSNCKVTYQSLVNDSIGILKNV